MDKEKVINNKYKLLGYYQILGGISGLALTIYLIAGTTTITGLSLIAYLIALGLYGFSIYCGIQAIKKRSNSLMLSKVNQYLQLVNFSIAGYGFTYVSGLLLSVGVNLTNAFNFQFNLVFLTKWSMNWNTDVEQIEFNLNLAALFFIIFIDKLENAKSLDNQKLKNEEDIEPTILVE